VAPYPDETPPLSLRATLLRYRANLRVRSL
jgi:hypothetical protein